MTELPLAPTGCSLDVDGAASQGERYAVLGSTVTGIERHDLRLIARFGAGLDEKLLEETIAVERACCTFFSIEFDPVARRLELTVPDAQHEPALDAIQSALERRARTRMGAWEGSTS